MFMRFVIGIILGFIFGAIWIKEGDRSEVQKLVGPSGGFFLFGLASIGWVLYSATYGFEFLIMGAVEIVIGVGIAMSVFGDKE